MDARELYRQQVWHRSVNELPFSFVDTEDKDDPYFWIEMDRELLRVATLQVPPTRHPKPLPTPPAR